MVALRKESVDRNRLADMSNAWHRLSLSARRAWIEMCVILLNYKEVLVALRKESVDRNSQLTKLYYFTLVALRKESVDRNGRPIDVQLIK